MKNKIIEKILAERYEQYLTEFRGVVPRIRIPVKPVVRPSIPSTPRIPSPYQPPNPSLPGAKPFEVPPHFDPHRPFWRPGTTKPIEPKPTEPKPIEPKPKEPKPTEPKPKEPKPSPVEIPSTKPSSFPVSVPVLNPALNPLVDPVTSQPIASPIIEPILGGSTSIPSLLTVPTAAAITATATQLQKSNNTKKTTTKTGNAATKTRRNRRFNWSSGQQKETGAESIEDSGNLIARDIDLSAAMLGKYSRYLHI